MRSQTSRHIAGGAAVSSAQSIAAHPARRTVAPAHVPALAVTRAVPLLAVALLVAALLASSPRPVEACGPEPTIVTFEVDRHPDRPFEDFAGGRLGIIGPDWPASFLLVAYRRLSGVGLEPDEQKALVDLWEERLTRRWERQEEYSVAYQTREWLRARKEVPGAPAVDAVSAFKLEWSPGAFIARQNCGVDAFTTATATLRDRIARYGATSPWVRDWLTGQDAVFENCSADTRVLPGPPPPDAPPLLRADRAYQTAAAHFYACDYEEAASGFAAIGRDPASPWHVLGPYLEARALAREAMSRPADLRLHSRVRAAIVAVLADPALADVHHASRLLLRELRTPDEQLVAARSLAGQVLRPRVGPALAEQLDDLATLPGPADEVARIDVLDWVRTVRAMGRSEQDQLEPDSGDAAFRSEAAGHALERWQITHSLPWLVAALIGTSRDSSDSSDSQDSSAVPDSASPAGSSAVLASSLLIAAAQVPASSPAWTTVAWHRARLLLDSSQRSSGRKLLEAMIEGKGGPLPRSSLNRCLEARLKLARTFPELLAYGPRVPVDLDADSERWYALRWAADEVRNRRVPTPYPYRLEPHIPTTPMLDADSAPLFDALPLRRLREAMESRRLPLRIRQELGVAAWARAILLERDDEARAIAVPLRTLAPRIREGLNRYLNAPDATTRRFEAWWLLLNERAITPSVREPDTALNAPWWCGPEAAANKPGIAPLSASETREGELEHVRLTRLGSAPALFLREVIAYARAHREDPRIPEALHGIVRGTHNGCPSAEASRGAFAFLHRHYPGSGWAKRTKYWYAY